MHTKRWITGIIAVPIISYLVYKGHFIFTGLIAAASLISLLEYFKIILRNSNENLTGIFPFLAFLAGPAIVGAAHFSTGMVILVLALDLLAAALIIVFSSETSWSRNIDLIGKQILGIVYIPLFLSCLVLIRNGQNGIIWIFLLLAVIFAGDTSAFYVGTYFGKHKLCPAVSPGKTVEGAFGGLLANILAGSLIKFIFLPELEWGASLAFFLFAGAVGQLGDLYESVLKRMAGIKDSGKILPGHGGILDRIDALLFAAPVALLFQIYMQPGP